jgi:hypothetical protein
MSSTPTLSRHDALCAHVIALRVGRRSTRDARQHAASAGSDIPGRRMTCDTGARGNGSHSCTRDRAARSTGGILRKCRRRATPRSPRAAQFGLSTVRKRPTQTRAWRGALVSVRRNVLALCPPTFPPLVVRIPPNIHLHDTPDFASCQSRRANAKRRFRLRARLNRPAFAGSSGDFSPTRREMRRNRK